MCNGVVIYIKCKRNLFIVFNNTLFISCVDILSFNIQNDNIKYAAATSLHGRLLVHVVTGTLGADDVLSVLGLYRVSSETVYTWLFALLSASTHANLKSWDIFLKFRKFATK